MKKIINKKSLFDINFEKFTKNIKNILLENKIYKIIIGLSCGPDSRLLLEFFHKYSIINKNIQIIACHIKHELLDPEWAHEEEGYDEFCKKTCDSLNIPIFILKPEKKDFKNCSLEACAREARYSEMKKILEIENADFIALGHVLDDSLENFFIKIYRGASIDGLSEIKKINNIFLRPILNFKKIEIIKILNEQKIEYIDDPCNISDRFLRSVIRKKLFPILNEIDSRFEKNLEKTIKNITEANETIKFYLEKEWIDLFDEKNKTIDIKKLNLLPIYLKKEIILKLLIKIKINKKYFSTGFLDEILRFIYNKKTNKHLIGNIIIKKTKSKLSIE